MKPLLNNLSSWSSLSPSITTMIRMDHTHVLSAFHQYRADSLPQTKQSLANLICQALTIHATLEEEIFYPAMSALDERSGLEKAQTFEEDDSLEEDTVLEKSKPEHDEMRALVTQLQSMQPADENFDETLYSLMRIVIHHVADEETVLLPQAEKLLGQEKLRELGVQMTKRRMQLVKPHVTEIARDTARGYSRSGLLWVAGAVLGLGFLAAKV